MKTTKILPLKQPYPLVLIKEKRGKKLECTVWPMGASLIVCDYENDQPCFQTFPIILKNYCKSTNTKVLTNEDYRVLDIHKDETISWSKFVQLGRSMDLLKDEDVIISITMMDLYMQLSWMGVKFSEIPDMFVINTFKDYEIGENAVYFYSEDAWFVDDVFLDNDKFRSNYFLEEIKFLKEINPKAHFLILNSLDNESLTNEQVDIIREKVNETLKNVYVKPSHEKRMVKKLIVFFYEREIAEKNEIINFVFNEFDYWKEEYLDLKKEEVWDEIEHLGIITEEKDGDKTTYSLNTFF